MTDTPVVGTAQLCRMTVLARNTQVDVAVPADVAIALVMPSIVDMIRGHHNDLDQPNEPAQQQDWTLARIGEPALPSHLSLNEHGVRDGELLMLQLADAPTPPPLFDDVMYQVASADTGRWSPEGARVVGSAVAVAATLTSCIAVLESPLGVVRMLGAMAAAFVAVLLLIASAVVSRLYADGRSGVVLCACALPLTVTAGAAFVPSPIGWPNILLAAALGGAAAVLALRLAVVGRRLCTGVATASVLVLCVALTAMYADMSVRALGAVATGLALTALAVAPRISIALARLPLPAVPAAQAALSDADDAALPDITDLTRRAEVARASLTGLIGATTTVAAAGALAAAFSTGHPYWPGFALSAASAAVLVFRGRTYASAEHAYVLIFGGSCIWLAMLGGSAITAPQPLVVFAVAIAVAGGALAIGIIAPTQDFSPPARRSVELLEYVCVAIVLPLVCWVAGLFEVVRGL
ncbi:type VII secretion integral membrane protein EccD [Skermania sp. ID1734]|uniref:type VII secretion integral membrane protein EccD n=1 Tax=Skermania sp. ID1734 TaxID=2597516 RepID=UPI00117DEA33|nr:type VII secretion integral membrane protein EccD [Skermania sp. ID1734]TSE02109.1 type VII secretion integral membrane protein EccD [Skermania sp. ID1734]